MSGPTFEFFAFSLVVVLVYNFARLAAYRDYILLVASLLFLISFSHDPATFAPFVGFLGAGYLALQLVRKSPDHAFVPALIGILLLFVWLKKYAFVPTALWLTIPYLTIGMSYILFRLLHLLIETRYNTLPNRIRPTEYLTYLLNFTTLVAGPIQRYEDFASQASKADKEPLKYAEIATALERIVIGLFKTNVLAALFSLTRTLSLERVVGCCGADGSLADGIAIFALYPVFLYCNFSGYIDIVLGIARLLRRQLPENFNRPFSSTSVIDFWNRWHITLSLWLKTYVYTPLLMSLARRFPSRALESTWAVVAFFLTFFLVGVWHGQTLEFLFFGFLTGLGMSANKMYQLSMQGYLGKKRYVRVSKHPLYVAIARGLTIAWFAFTLWWFWGTWEQVSQIANALGMRQLAAIWLAIIGGATALLWAWESVREYLLQSLWSTRTRVQTIVIRAAWSVSMVAVVGAVALLSSQPAPEIVYKAF